MYCKEEIKLMKNIMSILEWESEFDGRHNVIKCDGFPIVINNKNLIEIEENLRDFNRNIYMTFRPLTNGRHVGLLMDFIYEYDDDIVDEIITIKNEDGSFTGCLRGYNGETILEVNGSRETECKFKLFYEYYLEEKCDKEIEVIFKNEEKIKAYVEKNRNKQSKSKKERKK